MVDNPKAAVMIIAVVSVLAFAVGCVVGSFHVGQDYSEQLIPTSLTSSDDMIKPIKETNTTMYNVSIKQPQPQKKAPTNYTKKNTTNSSNSSNSSSSGSQGSSNSSNHRAGNSNNSRSSNSGSNSGSSP